MVLVVGSELSMRPPSSLLHSHLLETPPSIYRVGWRIVQLLLNMYDTLNKKSLFVLSNHHAMREGLTQGHKQEMGYFFCHVMLRSQLTLG